MARHARILSESGIYHVMLRGINRQEIFYDEEDNRCFIGLLNKYREVSHYELYAYCLMGNHVHMLIGVKDEPISEVLRRLGVGFAIWYNIKYRRTGHVFQDRFKSEPVESDSYFLTVLRYILNNPVKAGICRKAEEYRYSSAAEYLEGREGISDTGFALKMRTREQLMAFLREENEDKCLEEETEPQKRVTDSEAAEVIVQVFGTMHPEPGKKEARLEFVERMRKVCKEGVTIRQFCRLSGIPKGIVERRR